MPNYRNKNRNRNKNKQRNKQQQQQKHKEDIEENCKKETKEPPLSTVSNSAPTTTAGQEKQPPANPSACQEVAGASTIFTEIKVADVDDCTSDKYKTLDASQNLQSLKKVPDVTNATTATATKTRTETNDTVLTEPSKCDNKSESKHGINVNDKMGNEKSKINDNQRATVSSLRNDNQSAVNHTTIPPSTNVLGKVIVHRIVCEDSNSLEPYQVPTANKVTNTSSETNESCRTDIIESNNDIAQEILEDKKELKQQQQHEVIHEIEVSDNDSQQHDPQTQLKQQDSKVIEQKVCTTDEETKQLPENKQKAEENAVRSLLTHQQQVKIIINKQDTSYDESPKKGQHNVPIEESVASKNTAKHEAHTPTPETEVRQLIPFEDDVATSLPLPQQHQAKVIVHQIFLEDKDDQQPKITSPTMREPVSEKVASTASEVKIVEVSDESLSDLEELRSPVVSEAESSIEYSDENQKISESITEVSSSSSSSTTSTQKQIRKQKRIALEHHFLPQMLNPRFLDSISEENSELSDNSENPLSRTASTDSATNCPLEVNNEKLNAKYPKSSLDFSKPHKSPTMKNRKPNIIREETKAVAVKTRLQDTPNADESCSFVRSCLSPESEAAEVVFINSASSSITDLHDMELFENNHTFVPEINLDTDLKETINTTKTENICFDSLTQSQTPLTSAFTNEIPEFCQIQSININNNNQTINNSKFINNNIASLPHTPMSTTNTSTETDTIVNTNSQKDSILSLTSSPANNQLVFAQIEEQISSVLSSINAVAKQHTTTTIETTSSSPSTPSSSSTKFLTNLSNTQKLPVTTTSTTAPNRSFETSREESFNSNSNSSFCAVNNAKTTRIFSKDVNMNTVRDIINENTVKLNDLKNNTNPQKQPYDNPSTDPKKLRLLCTETLASFPYGDAVLEELASVAQNIGESRAFQAVKAEENMPYPLPELPHIDDLQLSLKVGESVPDRSPQPPQHDQSWLGVPTSNDPKVLVCLSPSQRSYIQQKPEQNPDDLLDAHQKFVDRRGYHEYTKEQLHNLEKEKLAEQQLLQTAAIMKKLRKSITPPPPQIPPPPVPVKSSETATKAQNLSKRTINANTFNHAHIPNSDVTLTNKSEQIPAASNGEHNGEENKHRLLSIMQDTNESNEANKQTYSITSSSHENNSRQTTNDDSAPAKEQVPLSTLGTVPANKSNQFYNFPDQRATGNMQSMESSLGQMFPTMGSTNIFDKEHKRFSNIELSNTEPFCSQIMNTQPKRYSSIETHSYETKKLIENGKVIEDFSTTKHESKSSGEKQDDIKKFPLETSVNRENNSFSSTQKESKKSTNYQNDQEIMSDLNLNKHSSDTERKQQQQQTSSSSNEKTMKTSATEISHQIVIEQESKSAKTDENGLAKQKVSEYEIPKSSIQDTYEEFRQRAKAAADAVSTLPTLNSPATAAVKTKATSYGDKNIETISSSTATETTKSISSQGHEKLFKEFDDLSKQLHKELETSKAEREQREKSASMFDLTKIHMRQKQQIEEFNKSRHEHLKELEQQIERSMRSRSLKLSRPQEPVSSDVVDHQTGRTYEIPIQIENGNSANHEEAPPIPKHPKTYQIPIHMENGNYSNNEDERFRRAESMFNLSDDVHQRQRTYSNQAQYQKVEDDWSKYASDLGSSENIVRPFAKEVEICYQRRPGGIRAPRLTVSTNDLSFNNQHSYDQHNAYNVRKHHHAPMLNRAPEQTRPKYGSCYSMIERDPNPKYISTTTRRGVSPAPQTTGYFPLDGCHVREEDMHQRRASLPRELHEQQLKYITSKEEELRTEFERLQSERRRLMEEAQRVQALQTNQTTSPPIRPMREMYRQTQKLPTLTEDEVFRQQMAEEWLNKVAEREKRKLQNIIKISKIHDDELSSKHNTDMGEEFLSRVKERRHKLAMPADSDWESGAESQPTLQAQLSEAEDVPHVKILEGEQEASLRRLPRHLREFAKFSNHQKESIAGGHREQHQEEERSEEMTENSVSKAFKKSSVVKTVKTLRAPMLPDQHGYENDNDVNRNVYENFDADDIDVSTLNRNTFETISNLSSLRPRSTELFTQFPGSFDEMFGKSQFRSHILEEFNNYWRNFHDTGNNF